MSDRWSRAEERYRQRSDEERLRHWRGRGRHAADDWDDDEDDTTVIPRYTDEVEPEPVRPQRIGQRGEPRPTRSGSVTARRDPDGRGQAGPRSRGQDGHSRESRAPGGRGRDGDGEERTSAGRGQAPRTRRSRMASRKAAERRRRRRNVVLLGCVFVVLILMAGGYAGYQLIGRGPADFSGAPGPLVVVQVQPGDTAEQIATTMVAKGVVESAGAFYQAAVGNSLMKSVQPGYYQIPSHSKGSAAVAALVGNDARVGNVVISDGRRLHDATDVVTGARTDGIYRKIADASCLGIGAGKKCVTYEQLDAAGADADLVALGVPAWALDAVRQVPDRTRQLEGLIEAGTWNFDPSGTPVQILNQLITESAHAYEATGLLQSGAATNLTPYQVLTAASLVEREALVPDMPKVARVIVNRLAAGQPLQFDSTVNYTLDSTEVATTDADRARKTPWNTYAMTGLPATPIASPSLDALRAMESPAPGPWLYFVTVDKQGTTLFTDSYAEHQRNIERARQSGILDSGR
jgi:UPF0755 protein